MFHTRAQQKQYKINIQVIKVWNSFIICVVFFDYQSSPKCSNAVLCFCKPQQSETSHDNQSSHYPTHFTHGAGDNTLSFLNIICSPQDPCVEREHIKSLRKETSLLRRLQAQTLPNATTPQRKIPPFTKIAVTFEPINQLRCPLRFRISKKNKAP